MAIMCEVLTTMYQAFYHYFSQRICEVGILMAHFTARETGALGGGMTYSVSQRKESGQVRGRAPDLSDS